MNSAYGNRTGLPGFLIGAWFSYYLDYPFGSWSAVQISCSWFLLVFNFWCLLIGHLVASSGFASWLPPWLHPFTSSPCFGPCFITCFITFSPFTRPSKRSSCIYIIMKYVYPGFYLAILYVTLNISILFELGSLRGGTFSSDFSLTETVHTITGHSFQDGTCSTPKE